MMAGYKNAYDCIKAFSETDFTEDLKKFDVPTLIIHGDDGSNFIPTTLAIMKKLDGKVAVVTGAKIKHLFVETQQAFGKLDIGSLAKRDTSQVVFVS